MPLRAGVHDALLVEMLDCAAAVASAFVDWLHDEGALLCRFLLTNDETAPEILRGRFARPISVQREHARSGRGTRLPSMSVSEPTSRPVGVATKARTPTPRLRVGFQASARPVFGLSAPMPTRAHRARAGR